MKDYDFLFMGSEKYKTVVIGTQTWMADNLNTNASGSKCPLGQDNNCNTCGRLYNWKTAMANKSSSDLDPSGVQGICPSGWHLPSPAEWTKLTNFVSTNAGTKPDDFGFNVLRCGYANLDNTYPGYNYTGYWWTTTGNSESATIITNDGTNNFNSSSIKSAHYISVRCVKDNNE